LERSFANGPGKICFVVFSAATNQEQRFHLEGNTSLSGFFYRSHKETEENRIPEFSLKSSGYDSESYIKRCEMIAADRTRRSLFWGTKPAAWGQRSSHV
ncbi:MAG: hypothetical protein Q8S17_09090, partial [Humidesulfovibrio sp.]|nr:hypothetical protein [Humidesulfovibrio sp.]